MTGHERRREAALRVRGMYPPLREIFASLRASLDGHVPAEAPATEAPAPPPVDVPRSARPPDLATALADAARAATGDPDDVAFALALAVEEWLADDIAAGTLAAREAGVPGAGAVPAGRAIDAVLAILGPFAAEVAAGRADVPDGLVERLHGVARSAGVVEAVRGTSWEAVQRFGDPYCPRSACFGRDGSLLTDERIAAEGFPPYGDGCNCTAEPADLP